VAAPIDYFSQPQEQIFFNPRLSEETQRSLRQAIQNQEKIGNHFWLMSSGTESARLGKRKMVALSREAILAAAAGVVETFQLTSKDIYLKSLPTFHIGGLAIYARAHLAGFPVLESDSGLGWSLETFISLLVRENITVASLVPPQIFDLVEKNITAPKSLRWIFVGGGALSAGLYKRARELGWPLVLSYGMTETCAMLAYNLDGYPGAQRLPQIKKWRVEKNGRLSFFGTSLLTSYLFADSEGQIEIVDPKVEGWYCSDDCGDIKDDLLYLKGRESEIVKINGETVSLLEVQALWEEHLQGMGTSQTMVVLPLPEKRRGFELLVASTVDIPAKYLETFNQKVLPFQRLQRVVRVSHFPLNELGKVLKAELVEKLSKTDHEN
jgi:O-succinylbenzoic acid--CoA ligase